MRKQRSRLGAGSKYLSTLSNERLVWFMYIRGGPFVGLIARGNIIRRPIDSRLRLLASFAIAVLAGSQTATADDGDRYVDRSLGFSFSKPRFTPSGVKDITTVAVTLSGAPVGGFAPNVNVVVQNLETTLDAFQQLQLQQLKALGWAVVEQSQRQIGGQPALWTHARGSAQGLEVEFVAVARFPDGKKMFMLTCTTTTETFALYEAEFERVASSFALEP